MQRLEALIITFRIAGAPINRCSLHPHARLQVCNRWHYSSYFNLPVPSSFPSLPKATPLCCEVIDTVGGHHDPLSAKNNRNKPFHI